VDVKGKLRVKGDYVIFSSGRKVYANCGILGLADRDGVPEVTDGYDGGYADGEFSAEERREMAKYMVNLWKRFGGLR
jgi:hypothetical protein